jgi:hypothetical protein
LRVFENGAEERVFELNGEEVVGGWRRLHSEELHNLYTSPNIVRVIKLRMMRYVGHVASMGEMWSVYKILVAKPEGKSPLGRPSCR